MLRVVLTNDAFIPIIDGVGRVVYEYAHALGSRGHECYVVAPMSDAGYRAQYPFEIVDFQSITLPGMAHYRTGVATLDKHYINRMSTIHPDLIHAHSPGPAGMEAVRLASKLKVPLIGTFHSKFYDDFLRATRSEGLAGLGVRYVVDFFDRCDEVWTVSQVAAETLREYGYRGQIEIVQNGVNTHYPQRPREEAAALAREAFSLSKEMPVLLYVGQIDWKKNLRTLLEGATLLYRGGRPFQLVLAGQGQDMEAAREMAKKLMPEGNIIFTGHITDNNTLLSLYSAASLFVFPSEYDTAGLVVREAAIAGTPSVVLRGSAPAEVIKDGETGFLCENDPRSLCDAILKALEDTQKLSQVGRRAQKEIPVPWETVIDEVVDRYEHILQRQNASLKRKRGFFRKELSAMDQTLEKRTVDLLWRFLKQDMQHIYSYDYVPGKTLHEAAMRSPLPRSAPEAQGVPSGALLELYRAVDADEEARVQGMTILRNGHIIAEGAWAPHETGVAHQLFSMSKSITATAIGMLVDADKLSLDERIVDIFADKVQNPETHPMRDCNVWHLLTMSTGAKFNEVGTALGNDWIQEFLDGGVRFEAGSQFYYNSLNTYMLVAIIHRKTGESMMDYLRPRLFEPLRIASASWETCPQGIEKGGWGLSLTMEDVAKIGLLYLQKGEYEVDGEMQRLVSREWVEAATSVQIETPNGECKDGYGYQIWMAPHKGCYLFNGAFGQYMIALPHANALAVVFSGSSRLFAQGGLMQHVLQCFARVSGESLPENPRARRVLRSTLSMLSLLPRQSAPEKAIPMPFEELCSLLDGISYTFGPNSAGLLPVVQQSVYNNYSPGIDGISFASEGEALYFTIREGEISNTFKIYASGFWRGQAQSGLEAHEISVSAKYGLLENGDLLLVLYIYFLETPCTRILTLDLREDSVTLLTDENPSIRDAAAMLMELSGITQTELLRGIMPLLKRDSMQNRIRSYTTSTLEGKVE